MGHFANASILQKQFEELFMTGCSTGCDIEESDGGVNNHCDACCQKLADFIQRGARHKSKAYQNHLVLELIRRKFLPVSYQP